MTDYGQRPAMEDESMVGTLAAQAEMVWPIEKPLLQSLGLGHLRTALDLGCGTGEIAGRVARAWPHLEILGLDLYDGHLAVARDHHPSDRYPNLAFQQGDAYETCLPDGSFDAVLVRHVLHALPDRAGVLAEARRVLVPGGLLYVLAEDYAGLLFDVDDADSDAACLFHHARAGLLKRGTDLFHGRRALREVQAAGFEAVRAHALLIDTERCDRATFARMLSHWRDGYASLIAETSGREVAEIEGWFDTLAASVRDPNRYACWLLLAVAACSPI